MKLVYPAIFLPFDEGNGYTVEIPDLPGCVSEGNDLDDAIAMVTDAACGWILTELEDGNKPPKSSSINEVKVPKGAFVSLITLDMDAYVSKYGNK